jgi:hypothetical protein
MSSIINVEWPLAREISTSLARVQVHSGTLVFTRLILLLGVLAFSTTIFRRSTC